MKEGVTLLSNARVDFVAEPENLKHHRPPSTLVTSVSVIALVNELPQL